MSKSLSYVAAAMRSFSRSRFYSTISVFGLAMGLWAALLMALVIRNEITFEHFIPGYERTYLLGTIATPTGHPPLYDDGSPSWVAASLEPRFASQMEAVARVSLKKERLRHGRIESQEQVYWADPNVFDVLPLPSIAGDLRSALRQPDTLVLTRSLARKYFGRDTPLGESLLLDGQHPMRVTAVIADLPIRGTELESGLFAAGSSSYSRLTLLEQDPQNRPDSTGIFLTARTYLRLKGSASLSSVGTALPGFLDSLRPPDKGPVGMRFRLQLIPIDRVHLSATLSPGTAARLSVIAVVALLILVIAIVNFVNLSTARATRRALEVGVRKVCGAGRASLIVQFLGESLIYTSIATAIAVMWVELSIPWVNAYLQTGATFMWWREPILAASMGAGALVVAMAAGTYPAFVLSAFRPATALRSRTQPPFGTLARRVLVGAQFTILIGLIVAAAVVYEQRAYATREALRVNADQMLIIRAQCGEAIQNRLRALPGVRGAICSDQSLLTNASFGNFVLQDGSTAAIDVHMVEAGIFAIYGLKPVAGAFSSVADAGISREGPAGFVINETAVRRLGFTSAKAAIGQNLPFTGGLQLPPGQITAVIPDFAINAVDQQFRAALYFVVEDIAHTSGIDGAKLTDPPGTEPHTLISVKLTGRKIPETLAAIDHILATAIPDRAINRQFLNDYIQNLYLAVRRQEQAFAIGAGLSVLIACLGLAGLSASMAERRTKEIGIRKAMGADTSDILRLLLWQFAQPVLWSIGFAWVISGLLMNRWLHGFAYHVDLDPWVFVVAAVMGLAIALCTVGGHCYLIARAKPVAALRYE